MCALDIFILHEVMIRTQFLSGTYVLGYFSFKNSVTAAYAYEFYHDGLSRQEPVHLVDSVQVVASGLRQYFVDFDFGIPPWYLLAQQILPDLQLTKQKQAVIDRNISNQSQ